MDGYSCLPLLWREKCCAIIVLPNGRRCVLFLDSCSSLNLTSELEAAASRINITVKYFPPNATHIVQPCDSFVILKNKCHWATHWENYKLNMASSGLWKDSCGRLSNPGNKYFLNSLPSESKR